MHFITIELMNVRTNDLYEIKFGGQWTASSDITMAGQQLFVDNKKRLEYLVLR